MSDPATAIARPTRVRWVILAVLFAVSLVAYVQRLNFQVASEGMKAEFGIDDIRLGWIFGAFALGYAAFQLPGGIFGERWGLRRSLTVIAALWGVVTILCGMIPASAVGSTLAVVGGLVVLRFAMGVFQAPLFPIVAGSIANWFPVGRWALPNALSSAGLNLGAFFTPPLAAWLMIEYGWRVAFFATAPLAFLAAIAWWWLGRDHPQEHAGVNAAEIALVTAGRPAPAPVTGRAWLHVLRNRETLLLALAYLCMNYIFYIFFSWFFIYLVEERHFELLKSGFYAGLPWCVGAVFATIGGETCDRLCRRIGPRWGCRVPAMTGLLLVAALLFAGATAQDPLLAIALLSLCFGCTQLTEGPFWSAQTYVGGEHTAAASGVLNTGGNLGGAICSPLIPVLVHYFGWIPALASGSIAALIGALLWLFIRADRPLQA
jgi:ACS family glucarate transporter-like MFS transporter